MSDSGASEPTVSFVVPARNEAEYLPATLESIREVETDHAYETIVVDGDSDDATPKIATEHGARLVDGGGEGIGHGRDAGARAARGEWLAFIDADTTLSPEYLDTMLEFVRDNDLAAASSRCRMNGPRARLMQATINRVLPRLHRPILPGFNFFIRRSTYEEVGGFSNVPNEDTAFSRRLARTERTGYCPRILVETSPRRIADTGLSGTLSHYLRLDWKRYRTEY